MTETRIDAKRRLMIEALRIYHGDVTNAAIALGIGRSTLYRKLRELEVRRDEYIPRCAVTRAFTKEQRAEVLQKLCQSVVRGGV